jgi:hypothetical protein
LTARSKPISGELFQLIADLVASFVSVVASFGNSPNSADSVSQPSSNGAMTWLSKRTGGLVVAPRPWRASDGMLPASASSRMVRSPSVHEPIWQTNRGRSRTI